jgi:cytoskeleton protein RodZ
MNELGQWLRETREAQGLSLAEAEAATRIRQKFLAAMEAEDWDQLPGEVTTRGFLRKYATYLGMDVNQVVKRFQDRGSGPVQLVPDAEDADIEREVDYRPIEMDLPEPSGLRLPWSLVALVLIVAFLGLAAWWILTYQSAWVDTVMSRLPGALPNPSELVAVEPTATRGIARTRIVIRVTATPSDTPEASPTPQDPTPTPNETSSGQASPAVSTPEDPRSDRLQLHLDVVQRSWLRVVVDGQTRLEAVIEPGEQLDWEGQETIIMRTGNASGVMVVLNEVELEPLGGPGEVVELQWSLENGQVVQNTPTATATPTETPASS